MNRSLNRQFAWIFGILLTGTILLCWFLNSIFLEKYYFIKKQGALHSAYNKINTAALSGDIDNSEFDLEIEQISGTYNIEMIVIDSDSETVKTTASYDQAQLLIGQLLDHLFLDVQTTDKIIEKGEQYTIQQSMDKRSKTNFLEMWGTLDNGYWYMIRSPLEGIRDSAQIANRFLAYVGIFAVFAGCIITLFVTRRVTKPILQLAQISAKMKNLDFEVKYDGKEKNEIGVLGQHFNELSDTLQQTISELKTANNELQNDIENKEKIDTMRREFLSNVSHELKTPIALIMGYAEGLKMGINEDDESREFYCDVIMDEANKMNVMVKKLLTLNQLEFGDDTVVMERFDIVELIRNYLRSSEILIQQKEVQVIFEEDAPIYVWGDEFKVEEVFMNYFSNALNHAAFNKQIMISVERMEEQNKVRVKVFNTGEQIPEESLPNLWDKFYKVDKARTREYGGSGVGLSIVKAIMESLNQSFGVDNKDTGVEFWFELSTK